MPDLIRERNITCQKMKISRMWQITIQKIIGGKTITLTKSKYPTKQAAKDAATQLRMISTRWTKGIRDKECERPNAKPVVYRFHNYTVTPPQEV